MTETDTTKFTGVPKVEDVMAALATQSIFDLQTLGRKLVAEAQEKAEAEDDPGELAFLIHKFYVVWHDETVS